MVLCLTFGDPYAGLMDAESYGMLDIQPEIKAINGLQVDVRLSPAYISWFMVRFPIKNGCIMVVNQSSLGKP